MHFHVQSLAEVTAGDILGNVVGHLINLSWQLRAVMLNSALAGGDNSFV